MKDENRFLFNFKGEPVDCEIKGRYVKGKKITKIIENILDNNDDLFASQAVVDVLQALDILTLEEHNMLTELIRNRR